MVAISIETPTVRAMTEPGPFSLAPHRIRRCHYRRLTVLDGPRDRGYGVECLQHGLAAPIVIGEFLDALSVCNACTIPNNFRDDED